jgi:hypothetical protein
MRLFAGPESKLATVVMNSGLALRAPRNDEEDNIVLPVPRSSRNAYAASGVVQAS